MAAAAATRDTALAFLDASFASQADSTWSSQLGNSANATNDPWFDLAEDLASARSTRSTASATAATTQASAHALALEAFEVDLSGSVDLYSGSFSSAAQAHSTSVSTSTRDFTDTTGTGSATPARGNNFAATWAGDEKNGQAKPWDDDSNQGQNDAKCPPQGDNCIGHSPKRGLGPDLSGIKRVSPVKVGAPVVAPPEPNFHSSHRHSCISCHNPIMMYGTNAEKKAFLEANPSAAMDVLTWTKTENLDEALSTFGTMQESGRLTREVVKHAGALAATTVSGPLGVAAYIAFGGLEAAVTGDPYEILKAVPGYGLLNNTSGNVSTITSSEATLGEKALAGVGLVGDTLEVIPVAKSLSKLVKNAPRGLTTRPQVQGVPVLPRNPLSAPISKTTRPGTYVFVRDADGVIHIVPDGPGLHPTVLGNGRAASAAGEITIGPNGVVTEINNISYTFQFGSDVLPGVKAALERLGLSVVDDAIKPFTH